MGLRMPSTALLGTLDVEILMKFFLQNLCITLITFYLILPDLLYTFVGIRTRVKRFVWIWSGNSLAQV